MSIGLRLLYRDWRGGDVSILLTALTLAVAIVTGVGLFSERLGNAIIARSSGMLGADLVLQGPRPLDETLLALADAQGLRRSHSVSFATMASRGEGFQLSSVTAVDSQFPLKGKVRLASTGGAGSFQATTGLQPGRLWVDQRLLSALDAAPEQRIEVGEASLVVANVLVDAPGGGISASFALGPRLLMHIDDLPATRVIQPGSRVRHRYYFAGDAGAIAVYREQIEPRLLPEHRVFTVTEGRPGLAGAIEKARTYLLLGGALGVALAGAAIAIATRRYTERHIQSVAVLKTLGASGRQIMAIYGQKILLIAGIAIALGFALGWLIQSSIVYFLGLFADVQLERAGWHPYRLGAATGLVCVFAFALPPLWALHRVSPLAALRKDTQVERLGPLLSGVLGLSGLFGLIFWYSQSLQLTGAVFAGLMSAVVVVGVLGFALIRSTHFVGANAGNRWLLASSSLRRRGAENAMQIVVFAITISLLLVLLVTRTSLIGEWAKEIPEGTPNHFLVNLLPGDVSRLEAWLSQHELSHAGLYAVVRGRLTHINEEPLKVRRSDSEGSSDLDRELSLTSSARPPRDNLLVEGRWWHPDSTASLVSVEAQLAERLGIDIGDRLRFQVGSDAFVVTTANLRGVDWENMRPNFYMIFPPRLLEAYPTTYMTSFYLAREHKSLLGDLVKTVPAVSVIEIDAIIEQIRSIIAQVSLAIEAILWVVVACGALVLIATVQAGLDERFRESSILRTLGAPASLVLGAIVIEFALLGAMAGLLAALGAEATTWVLQEKLFQMSWRPHWWLWLLGPLLGTVLITTIGSLASRKVVAIPPVEVLRSLY